MTALPKTGSFMASTLIPDVVADSMERLLCMWEIGSLVPGRVKPVTYKIETCHFLARRSASFRIGQGLISSVSGNGTMWDISS